MGLLTAPVSSWRNSGGRSPAPPRFDTDGRRFWLSTLAGEVYGHNHTRRLQVVPDRGLDRPTAVFGQAFPEGCEPNSRDRYGLRIRAPALDCLDAQGSGQNERQDADPHHADVRSSLPGYLPLPQRPVIRSTCSG